MPVVLGPGSSMLSCRSEPRRRGTWIAMPGSVPPPSAGLDTVSCQRRPVSPRRCAGCEADSRVQQRLCGLEDYRTLCPDSGAGVGAVKSGWCSVPERGPPAVNT
jgi:hypothetical protein